MPNSSFYFYWIVKLIKRQPLRAYVLVEVSEIDFCRQCKKPLVGNVCKSCGAAFYEDQKATVSITAINYSCDHIRYISEKFMSPLVRGTIKRQFPPQI